MAPSQSQHPPSYTNESNNRNRFTSSARFISQIRHSDSYEWVHRHWRSFCIVLFVACSALLVALISVVAWSYYSGVVLAGAPATAQHNSELFDEPWNSEDLYQKRHPSFVNSESSELNLDELENTNSVNSALIHQQPEEQEQAAGQENAVGRDTLLVPGGGNAIGAQSQILTTGEFGDFQKPSDEQQQQQQKFFDLQNNQLIENAFAQQQQQQLDTVEPKIPPPLKPSKIKKPSPEGEGGHSKSTTSPTDEATNTPMTLYKLDKAAKAGAVCLDGSPPAYYHRPGIGPNERSWIIHFNGGAWCFDANACVERSHGSLGSTKKLPKSPPIIQGINSPNPTVNPDFYDWNLVWVVYCDGASFTGNREKPITSKSSGQSIYLRGKRVLNAIINDLLYNRDFKSAESVILTGSSAGSMAAIFQADYIASKFPPTVPVRVLADAGFFIDTSSIGGKNLQVAFKKVYEMQNASAGLNQACVRHLKDEPWRCFLPSVASLYVKTPMYVLNSAYDIWALIYFLGIDCKFPATGEKVQRRRRQMAFESEDSEPSIDEHLLNHQRRDVSGFEQRPFFRSYVERVHNSVKSVISNIASKARLPFRKSSDIANTTEIHLIGNHTVFASTPRNDSKELGGDQHWVSKSNVGGIVQQQQPSLLTITSTNVTVSNSTAARLSSVNTVLTGVGSQVKKTNVRQPHDGKPKNHNKDLASTKRNFTTNIDNFIPEQMKKLQRLSASADERISTLSHRTLSSTEVAGIRKSDTPPVPSAHSAMTRKKDTMKGPSNSSSVDINEKNKTSSSNTTSSKLKTFNKTDNSSSSSSLSVKSIDSAPLNSSDGNNRTIQQFSATVVSNKTNSAITFPQLFADVAPNKNNNSSITSQFDTLLNTVNDKHSLVKKHHVLKQRRSASIAREYINILRSDPPECTGGEINKALQYRDAMLKATSGSLSPDSGRFLVSCFDHSMSLFDETWNGIKIEEKSIQQAFGDWFFNRVPRDKSNLIDCKYPCNLSCP